jgi:hypothetical protein
VLAFLRFFGVTVAAVWFGATVFFTLFAGPAFFTDEMKRLFPPPYNGVVAELVLSRYFVLHYLCGCLALVHLGAEWMYSGKEPPRATIWLVGGVLGLSLLGGLWLQPKLHRLQQIKYAEHYRWTATPQQRAEAAKSFSVWHGVSQTMNLFVLAALWLNLARVIQPGEAPRFVSPFNKFGLDKRS